MVEPTVKTDQYELYLGDCLEILPQLGKVDAVVTDPPYGVNLGTHKASKEKRPQWLSKAGYSTYNDTIGNYVDLIIPRIKASLATCSRAVVFCAGTNIGKLPEPAAVGGVYIPSGCGRCSWGFQTVAHCLFYGKRPGLNNGATPVMFHSTETAQGINHPCPKPLGWMHRITSIVSVKDETILDPFMGSGTTGVACMQLGRKFIGIEIDPKYFEIAHKRIRDAAAQGRLEFDKPPQPIQGGLL